MNTKGFTLVEVMIATGLFVVLMVFGVGAVLNSNVVFKKNQSQRAVLDNMAFIAEDMARLLRTGSTFNCSPVIQSPASNSVENPLSCSPGNTTLAMAFEPFDGVPGDPNDQVVYVINSDGIYKSENGGASLALNQQFKLTDNNVQMNLNKSGFNVYGAETGDGLQASVVVRLNGQILDSQGNFSTPFEYQFTIAQRRIEG